MTGASHGSVDWRGLLVKRPYPWERDMTVCIAAACTGTANGDKERKIILCTDQKSSSALGSAETARKEIPLGNKWRCLTSGDEADILALVRLYRTQFADAENLKAETIDASMKAPLHQRKAELAEEYVRRRFAMSHSDFLRYGKERLPAEIFYDATQMISQLRLKAELIIAGFINGDAEIYYTDSAGEARAASHFAVVGEGEYVAHSSLLRRAQDDWTTMKTSLYNVYEAKRLSEAVGSVGRKTFMAVISPTERRRLTSLEFDKKLKTWYKKFGPQPIPDEGELEFEGEIYFEKDQ